MSSVSITARRGESVPDVRSFGVWMGVGSNPTFALKRLLSLVAITLTVSAIGHVLGHAAWIPLALLVAVWPLPFRCKVTSDTLSVRWLWVSHKVTLDELIRCTLAPDPRRWVLRRQTVLHLVRPGHPRLLLFAPLAVLRVLHAQVNLALRDRQLRGVSSTP